ncbi:hypothetical protein PIROE2DRAFT_6066 [Piromyces sp. E2]|nr:hypothetical protein PIROE2DRAFT_6066 [Piromyces sp. E2]|eukprot:OUM66648.1 hypothetical protein PIROE2DRAFT_6066 [Piromyces sp. E2]
MIIKYKLNHKSTIGNIITATITIISTKAEKGKVTNTLSFAVENQIKKKDCDKDQSCQLGYEYNIESDGQSEFGDTTFDTITIFKKKNKRELGGEQGNYNKYHHLSYNFEFLIPQLAQILSYLESLQKTRNTLRNK